MHRKTPQLIAAVFAMAGFFTAAPVRAADEVNIYSARHYDSYALLFDRFHKTQREAERELLQAPPHRVH